MIIECISDLHGEFPVLEGGDLLIIAGDLAANDSLSSYFQFFNWLHEQKYTKKVVIAGNHDMRMEREEYAGPTGEMKDAFTYLCDSGTEFGGLKIWGSPWTAWFPGINPICTAYTCKSEEELKEKWELVPNDTDILITHSPPKDIMDSVENIWKVGFRYGSNSLAKKVHAIRPKLHVFGHIHAGYGKKERKWGKGKKTVYVNASHMTEDYIPSNPPIRVIL